MAPDRYDARLLVPAGSADNAQILKRDADFQGCRIGRLKPFRVVCQCQLAGRIRDFGGMPLRPAPVIPAATYAAPATMDI